MQSRIKKSTILLIILITLLLHLLFIYFFTTAPFSYSNDSISQLIDTILGKTPEKQPEQELQSHAPQQSAPVIFRDEPEEKEVKQPAPPPEPEQKMLVSHAANPLAKPVEEKPEQPKPVKKEEDQDMVPQSIPQDFGRASAERREDKPEKTVLGSQSDPSQAQDERVKKRKSPAEPTTLTDFDEFKTSEKKSISVRPESIEGPPTKKEKKSASSVRPELAKDPVGARERSKTFPKTSLADLSQQFMQKIATIQTGASGALRVQGNSPYGHPSAYQIALERYVAKMCLEIETAYRIGTNQSIQGTQHKPFLLVVEVNSDGRINTIYPSQSSGVARIDEFAMSVFKSASKSFPKLPEAIGTNFRIQFGINHIDHLGELRHGTLSNG